MSEKIIARITPFRVVYSNHLDFKVLACHVDASANIKRNRFGDISISGNNLNTLALNVEAEVEIALDEEAKYEGSYVFCGFAGVAHNGERFVIESPQDYNLLLEIMSASQANSVYSAYPNFIEKVMNGEEQDIDIKKIFGVGNILLNKYVDKIHKDFRAFAFSARASALGIIDFGHIEMLSKIFASPEEMEREVKASPYKIFIEDLQIPFTKADKIIMKYMGDYVNDVERCEYCIDYILCQIELDGDTRISGIDLKEIIDENYPEISSKIATAAKNDTLFFFDSKTKTLARKVTHDAEVVVAHNILDRIANPISFNIDWTRYKTVDGFECTDEQMEILRIATKESFGLLTGSAGVGKTASTKALIKMLDDNGKSYKLLAPTGIASKRLNASTGRPTKTIAMYLVTDGKSIVNDYDYLIIDEASIMGVIDFAHVLETISSETKVILVCDNAQLASISCGNVVQDIIDSGIVPTAKLTKVFRYGIGGIATIATDTRNGILSDRNKSYPDYRFIRIGSHPIQQVVDIYAEYLEKGYTVDDILVLTPYNKYSLGTIAINKRIEAEFNKQNGAAIKVGQVCFKIGDKVVNTKNNYRVTELDYDKDNLELVPVGLTPVFNGDIGYIRDIFQDADENVSMYIQFDEKIVMFTSRDIQHLLLGYAMTIHRVQGCQAKVVIMITSSVHNRLLSRNLLYVGISRAQEQLVEIGELNAIENALEIEENMERNTALKDLLAKN